MPQPRVNSTVVCVVGEGAGELAEEVGASLNCRAVRPEPAQDPLDRAVAAWREATRAHVPWLLHDADPLAAVAEAYRAFFDEDAPDATAAPADGDRAAGAAAAGTTGATAAPAGGHGALEVAVQETLLRWRAGSLALPDYYLVADPDQLPPTLRHLYLGALHDQRPARVQPVTAEPEEVRRRLPRLRAARWWPELDALLGRLTRHTPDALHRPPAEEEAAPAAGPRAAGAGAPAAVGEAWEHRGPPGG